ncbi:MAG: hypothetical protein ACTSYF_13950 [Promethearchaeota archaeon]
MLGQARHPDWFLKREKPWSEIRDATKDLRWELKKALYGVNDAFTKRRVLTFYLILFLRNLTFDGVLAKNNKVRHLI